MRKLLLSVFAVLMCLSLFAMPVKADQQEGQEKISDDGYTITVTYDVTTTNRLGKWDFDYHDSYFLKPAEQYNHNLARLSLGMALSAFRPNLDPNAAENPAAHLWDFMEQCKFTDLRTDDYDKNPSLYTVSTVLGHKTLIDEQGEFELIAVGVCGGGYKNEWMSNFSCGDDSEHLGFKSAASEVYDRLFGYIAQNKLNGKRLKVWVSGFSRAAAVSNIFARMVTDSDIFELSNVYAYTFATPRTTRRTDGDSYPNIYNICGKMDPVPHVAFADWGYDRYGTTLYTPAQQTDSDYYSAAIRASHVYFEHYGMDLWNNVEWDTKLRVLLDYLLRIAPTTEVYTKHLQDRVVRMWGDKSVENVMKVLMEIAEDDVLINESNKKEANSMLTFLAYSVIGYATKSSIDSKYLSEYSSIVGNLAHEHTPEVYLAWMYSSDDPAEIFSDNRDYIRCVITGDVDVAVLRAIGEEYFLASIIDAAGEERSTFEYMGEVYEWDERCGDIFIGRENGATVILIPKDETYKIVTRSNQEQTVETQCDFLKVGFTSSKTSALRRTSLKKGEYETFFSPKGSTIDGEFDTVNGNTFNVADASKGTSSELALILERMNFLHLDWQQLVIIAFTLPLLLITLISLFITTQLGRQRLRIKKREGVVNEAVKYDSRPAWCLHAILLLFLLQELLYWLMPNYMIQRSILKLIIGALLIYLAYRGYKRQPTPLSRIIVLSLFIFTLADIVINYSFGGAMLIYAVAEGFLTYHFFKYEKPVTWQYILWIAGCVLGIVIIATNRNLARKAAIEMIIYVIVLMAFLASSVTMPKKIRFGAVLLVVSNIMVFINTVTIRTLIVHVLSLGLFYLATGLFALGTRFKIVIVKEKGNPELPFKLQTEQAA